MSTPKPIPDFNFDCCAKCIYNSLWGNHVTAECHRSPDLLSQSNWPEFVASDWCGEFKLGTAYKTP